MKYCSNCGSKVEGSFCSNCGAKIQTEENNAQFNSEVNAYFQKKLQSSKNHDIYRLVVGIIMIIIGTCIFIAGMDEGSKLEYMIYGYDMTLAFTLPGLLTLAAGILSIVSRKVNVLLLISGILYLVAAICNVCGISDISILFILCCIFGPINIVFYTKTR